VSISVFVLERAACYDVYLEISPYEYEILVEKDGNASDTLS